MTICFVLLTFSVNFLTLSYFLKLLILLENKAERSVEVSSVLSDFKARPDFQLSEQLMWFGLGWMCTESQQLNCSREGLHIHRQQVFLDLWKFHGTWEILSFRISFLTNLSNRRANAKHVSVFALCCIFPALFFLWFIVAMLGFSLTFFCCFGGNESFICFPSFHQCNVSFGTALQISTVGKQS